MEGRSSAWDRMIRPLAVIVFVLLVTASGLFLVNQLLQGPATGGPGPGPTENQPPVVTVWRPNGGEHWTGGSVHAISWWMSDDADRELFVRLHYSTNAGRTWTLIGSGMLTNGSWPWTVPTVDTSDALVRVCATDSGNLTTCDDSDSIFTIDSTRPYVAVSLPADGATGVARDSPLIAEFSETMGRRSVEAAFFLQPAAGGIVFSWSSADSTVTVTHALFDPNTTYTWGFSCEARDASDPGNPLRGCPWSSRFLTGGGGGGNLTLPDLTLSPQDITYSPPDPVYGDIVTISATVHNVGAADASNVTVGFYDPSICLLTVEYVIGHVTVPFIPAGGFGTATVDWDTTKSADGFDVIHVFADPWDAIPELDERNNWASQRIYVRGTPCEGNQTGGISLGAWTFDNDLDGRYDDVVVLVTDAAGHAVQGASVWIDDVFYGLTPDTGVLVAYNFPFGDHTVVAVLGPDSARATFHSDG